MTITNEELGFIIDNEGTVTPEVSEPKYHHYDMYGRYSYSSDVASDRCTEVKPEAPSEHYNWNDVEWVYAPDVLLSPVGHFAPPLQKSK